MIKVFTLEGCSRCKALIGELNKEGIGYQNCDADTYGEVADDLERLLNTSTYPIITINKLGKTIYFVSEVSDHNVCHGEVLVYDSIPHAVVLIKKNL